MNSITRWVGSVLVALLALAGLTACGRAGADPVSVSCKNTASQIEKVQGEVNIAKEKVEGSTGTPGEKAAQKELDGLQKQLTELKKCDNPTAEPTASADCPAQFVQALDTNQKNRFVSEGFKGTPEKKRLQLIEALGHDYRYLDFVGEQLFHKQLDDKTLVSNGCLSVEGQSLHAKVEGALMASGVKNGEAPASSYNTGMADGKAVISATRGISGNRSATIYTMLDGTELIVMDRCGNLALPSQPPGIPHGPTDNPPPKKCPPNMPHGTPPLCKDGPEKDPYAQGNAPTGGGRNADPGPGEYKSPGDMTKPGNGPRQNPAPPKPSPGAGNSGSGGGSTPSPEPGYTPPPPESGAPPPSNPETGCTPIPGVEDCK